MSTIHNNLPTTANSPSTDTASDSTSTSAQVSTGATYSIPHAHLTAGEMAQTDSLQTPSVGVRSNVLNTKPPAVQASSTSKSSDLQSGQRRLNDLTNNFNHPATGGLILASEQGRSTGAMLAGSAQQGLSFGNGNTPTNYAASASGSSTSITQGALTGTTSNSAASTTTTSTSGSGNYNMPNIVSTDLDDASNNPVASAASNLISSASEMPQTGKCKKGVNGEIENRKSADIAATTGLSVSQSRILLRAMNQNNTANGTTVANNLTSNEQTILASAIETMQQLKSKGQGSSQAAQQIKAQLGDVSNVLSAVGNNSLTGSQLDQYRTGMNQLSSDVIQVGQGATSSLSTATSESQTATLVGPQLVDPNNP